MIKFMSADEKLISNNEEDAKEEAVSIAVKIMQNKINSLKEDNIKKWFQNGKACNDDLFVMLFRLM